jgi:hypothetical protein
MGAITTLAARVVIGGGFTKALDLSTPIDTLNIENSKVFANGTGANQLNQWWHDTRSVAAASENLDLAGGLTDPFGDTITFTTVKLLYVHNTATTAGYDLILSGTFLDNNILGGGSSTIIMGPDSVQYLTSPVDGFTVTAGTGDVLTVDPGANTIEYDMMIAGTV